MRVHLVHWDADEARERIAALTALGHDTVYLPGVTGTPLMRALRAGTPDCFLVDLSRRPSHGREAGLGAGLVDFKVCSVDATWSGLAFKRRRR
ncbi:MAG: hypothetical protein KA371_16130 [Acidobacteria bacterium]|nr:hypothetical protein [Acidobacteriota bacterium]